MSLQPLNDFAKIEVSTKKKFIDDKKDTCESGILVALPEKLNYYGYYSFAFEDSFLSREKLDELHRYWTHYVGKRVYWMALSEKGSMIQLGDDKFAFIKMTSLIAVDDDPDSGARNLHGDGAAAFKA